ncbi:MAG: hypothetical protein ABIK07_13690 [Planctomycetota bacterium]
MDDTNRLPEFRLPAPGMGLPVTIGYLLGLGFVTLAVFNLFRVSQIHVIYTIASILWLALVVFVIALNLRFEGRRTSVSGQPAGFVLLCSLCSCRSFNCRRK